ncbi:transmembrane protein 44 isoform X16 [Macaca fascicularis]
MFILFPVCGSKFKSNSDREARERKRRRQLRASVFALALPLSLGPCWALWVAAPKASATIRGPQRRLLASLLQENTEILGYLLGSIAAFGSWASRIPPLSRISKMRQALGFATEARESPDTQALLTCAEKEEENQEARNEDKNLDWVPLTTLSHCKSLRTMTAISRYMELTIEPVQQSENSPTRRALPPGSRRLPPGPTSNTGVTFQRDKPHPNHSREAGCSATRLPGDGQTSAADALLQEPPSYPPVQVIRARVSSSSSSEVSSINSDLEWDPEDVNLEGSKDKVELLGSQVHRDSVRTAHLNDDD